ncbi:MAG: extracellular solute-binding protein [Bacilli bacterium]|jgi:multiple sugar transport system substrate-binding protein|nr:extracellular solute-binding protein [Bacilli bacterium]
MKNNTTIILAVTLLCLVGCDNTSDDNIISFWAYQPSTQAHQNAFRELINDFSLETGIKVKLNLVVKDSFNTALNSALGGRAKPDMSYLDQPLIADYAVDGTIFDISSLFSSFETVASDDFFPYVYSTNIFENKLYGLPLNVTASVLFYNKELVSTPPTSWAEWLAVKDSLPSGKSLFDGIGNGGYAGWYFQAFLANCGGSLLNNQGSGVAFNDSHGVEAAQMIKDLYGSDPTSIINRGTSDAFGNGLVAFKLGSSSDIERFDTNFPNLDYGVALVPSKSGIISSSNMGGENVVVYSHSKLKENCGKLIEYLLKQECLDKLSDFTGNFPAIRSYAQSGDERLNTIIDQMETSVPRPVIPRWIRVNDEYLGPTLSDKILSDENPRDIQSSLDDAASAANQLLF